MNNVDERIVEMQFDNKQFESNVAESLSTLDKLKNALNFDGIKNGLSQISSEANSVDLTPLQNGAETVRMKFDAMEVFAFNAFSRMSNAALDAGKKIISALTIDPVKTGLQEYETKINAIQVIKANTRGKNTMSEITDALDELNTYADKTIYNFAQMTSNVGKFVAQGLDVESATKAIQGMANLAGASGATAEDMSRATYQMSQALGGTIRKIDWNSLRNANMATVELKNTLMDVARNWGIDIDSMIAEAGTFEDTLEKGWLSGDLFTEAMNMYSNTYDEAELRAKGYNDEQIKNFQDLAAMAEEATTSVKTVTQLWDVLKESAQSGWTQSWEYIFGGFDEALELFSGINRTLSGLIENSANARNDVLKQWHDQGGRDNLLTGIQNAAKGAWSVIESVSNALKSVFPPPTAKQLVAVTEAFKNFTGYLVMSEGTAKRLQGTLKLLGSLISIPIYLIGGVIKVFSPLIKIVIKLISLAYALVGIIQRPLELLRDYFVKIQKFGSITDTLRNNIVKLSDGVVSVIDKMIHAIDVLTFGVKSGTKNLKNLLTNLNASPNTGLAFAVEQLSKAIENVKQKYSQFKLAFISGDLGKAVIDFKNNVSSIFSPITEFFNNLGNGEASDGTLSFFNSLLAKVGELIQGFSDLVSSIDVNEISSQISGFVNSVNDLLAPLATGIQNEGFAGFAGAFAEENIPMYDKFVAAMSRVSEAINGVDISFKSIGDWFVSKFVAIKEALTEFAGVIKNMLAPYVDELKVKFDAFKEKVREVFGEISREDMSDAVQVGILAAILKVINDVTSGIRNAGKKLPDITEGVKKCLDSLRETLEVYQKSLKSEILLRIAFALGILAAAVTVLAFLPAGNLIIAVAALSVLGLMLTKVTNSLTSFVSATGSMKDKLANSATTLLTIGVITVAIGVLTASVVSLSKLQPEKMLQGLAGVGILVALVVAFASGLKRYANDLTITATGLFAMGMAMKGLAKSVKILSEIDDTNKLVIAFMALTGLMTVMVGAMYILQNVESLAASTTAIFVIAAALDSLAIGLSVLSLVDSTKLAIATGCLAGLLVVMALAEKMAGSSAGGGVGILAMAAALNLLIVPLLILSAIPFKVFIIGLGEMALALVSFGLVALLLKKLQLDATMLKIGGAVALLGAGVIALSVGLGMLAPSLLVAGGAIIAFLGEIIAGATVLIPGIVGMVYAILESVVQAAIAFVPDLLNGVFVILSALYAALDEWGPSIAEHIILLIINVLNVIRAYMFDIINVLVGIIVDIFNALAEAIRGNDEPLLDALNNILSSILELILSMIQDMVELIPGVGEKFSGYIQAAKDTLQEKFSAGDMSQIGKDGMSSVASGIDEGSEDLEKAAENAGDKVTGTLTSTIGNVDLSSGMGSMLTDMSSSLKSSISDISSAGSELGVSGAEGFESTASMFEEGGALSGSKIITGMASKSADVYSTAQGLGDKGVEGLESKYDSFVNTGGHWDTGTAKGIKDNKSVVINAAKEVAGDAVKAANDKLEIKSPSRVMVRSGMYFDLGFAKGITEFGKRVSNAAHGVADKAVNITSMAVNSMYDFMTGDIELDPVITPTLDLSDIRSGADLIGGIIGNQSVSLASKAASSFAERRAAVSDAELLKAVKNLGANTGTTNNYSINGMTYTDSDTAVANAITTLINVTRLDRRS